MTTTNMTRKGQVTVPKEYRDRFGLEPGTKIEFQIVNGMLVLRAQPPGRARMDAWIKRARGKGIQEMTAAKILRETRGED